MVAHWMQNCAQLLNIAACSPQTVARNNNESLTTRTKPGLFAFYSGRLTNVHYETNNQ